MDNTINQLTSDEVLSKEIIIDLSVDNLIFAMHEGKLKVVLAKYKRGLAKGKWGLIGHWVHLDESIEEAASRVVKETTGAENLFLEQLGAFGKTDRFPLRRVVTIAFYSLVRFDEVSFIRGDNTEQLCWFDVYDVPQLVYDHTEILQSCLEYLRYKVRHEPIGFKLLPEKFTLWQLQEIYEAVLSTKLDKPNFRRKFMKMNLLIKCNDKQQNVNHRAASLFRFDTSVYNKLKEYGFSFEF